MKKITIIVGSLREKSFNKSVANLIQTKSSDEVRFINAMLHDIPMFNEDLEADLPASVQKLTDKLRSSDGIIIVTPEYNNMLPGVIKNVLEWLSRPKTHSAIKDKLVGIVGATPGGFGTVRAQNQLLLLAGILGMKTSNKLRLPLSRIHKSLDSEGNINGEDIHKKIEEFLTTYLNSF